MAQIKQKNKPERIVMEKYNTRKAFGEALLELAEADPNVVTVSADTYKSMRVDIMKEKFPERCFEVGIAEQNMMVVAAGLAATGKTVFATSYSVFTSMRALEQLRTFVAYPKLNVKVVAGLGGFTAGIEGVTHVAMEDLGLIRCIPNITLLNPADGIATKKAVKAAAEFNGPAYIRIGRNDSPVIFDKKYKFTIGKSNLLIDNGNDATIIASGMIIHKATQSVKRLKDEGINVKLIEMHTLKPIDTEAIVDAAKGTGAIVTAEEHNCIGGLGSAVSEVLVKNHPVPMEQVAVDDVFTESATPDELRNKYGLTVENIIEKTKKAIGRKQVSSLRS
jgi:transketolase